MEVNYHLFIRALSIVRQLNNRAPATIRNGKATLGISAAFIKLPRDSYNTLLSGAYLPSRFFIRLCSYFVITISGQRHLTFGTLGDLKHENPIANLKYETPV